MPLLSTPSGCPALQASRSLSPAIARHGFPSRNPHRSPRLGWSVLAFLLCLVLGSVAHATTFVVTDNSDNPADTGSLRYAINNLASGTDPGTNTINFSSALSGQTIVLTSGTLTISQGVTINGLGANLLTISGNNQYTVLTITDGTVYLSGLTITNGSASAVQYYSNLDIFGGGINNAATLVINNCAITNNTASGSNNFILAYGGGIYNSGTLFVNNTTISGNSANGNGYGSRGDGGGIRNNSGTLYMTNSTVANNTVTGGTDYYGNGNYSDGGGIMNTAGAMVISNSTFANNSATFVGGAIENYGGGQLTLLNGVVSGNSSSSGGGGGIITYEAITVSDTVYWNNLARGVEDDCANCAATGSTLTNNISATGNPLLPLAGYGGPTQTMMPMPGSAAICAGLASDVPSGVTTDQRGFPRSTTYGPTLCVDAGAVQTGYQSLQFANLPASGFYSGTAGGLVTNPAPIASVMENGQNLGGLPLTLIFSGSGTATGLGPVTTVAGIGATFSALSVDTVGFSDTLSISLPVTAAGSAVQPDPLSAKAGLDITGGGQATPTITWAAPAAISYGTALSAAQLNASSGGVAGKFSYTPALGELLGAGVHTLSVTFTPDDAADYTSATASVSLTVNQAALAASANSYAISVGEPLPILDGTLLGVIPGDGITASYATAALQGSPVGSYPVTVTLNDPKSKLGNYSVTLTPGTLVVYDPALPLLLSLSPVSATRSGAAFTLTVNGANFTSTSRVLWNGQLRATMFVSSSQLTATILADDIADEGVASVTVVNPGAPAGSSSAIPLVVMSATPLPTVNRVTVASTAVDGSYPVGLAGADFVPASSASWNSSTRTTVYDAPGALTVTVSATDAATRPAIVTVSNPAGTSAAFTLR